MGKEFTNRINYVPKWRVESIYGNAIFWYSRHTPSQQICHYNYFEIFFPILVKLGPNFVLLESDSLAKFYAYESDKENVGND